MKQKITLKLFLCFLLFLSGQSFAQKYEAENAALSGDAAKANSTAASGGSYVQMKGGNITFSVQAQAAGNYNMKIVFSQTYDNQKIQYLEVNGAASGSIDFPRTGSGSNPVFAEVTTTVRLKAGANTIAITNFWGWVDIDYINLVAGETGGDDTFPPANVNGFKVDGAKLLDGNNNEFIMRGVNMAWTWYKQNGMAQLEAIARAGANTVRIVLSNGVQWTKDNATTVASLIQKCEDLRMVAVLEVHDVTGSDDINALKGAAQYFSEIKNVLIGKERTVIINIANEWHNSSSAANWKDGYLAAIPIIRNAGLRHCVMIDAGGYGQNAGTIHSYGKDLLKADPEHNLIFSIHMYGTAGSTNRVKTNIDGVINQDLALCIGEFGWYHSDGDVDEDLILSYCKEKNVGWLAWSWYGNGSPVQYLDLVTSPTDETKVNSPTTAGKSCNWGAKIINAWKAEAQICSVYLEGTDIKTNEATILTTVYPTKVKDAVYVICPEPHYSISITDAVGRLISFIPAVSENTVISCSNWNQGIYYLSVITNNGKRTFPVVKQ